MKICNSVYIYKKEKKEKLSSYIDAQFVAVFVGREGWENLCKFGGQTDRKERDN